MMTRIIPLARPRPALSVRRGGVIATLAAVLAVFAAPAFSVSAAPCDGEAVDFDGDGLTCYDEVYIYGTDPYAYDTDNDGYSDSYELFVLGTNPILTDGAALPSGGAYDSDFDGLPDSDEINLHGTDPYNSDTDGDGLSDSDEWLYPSNPLYFDTDGDGYADGYEYQAGTDLLNPDSFPPGVG